MPSFFAVWVVLSLGSVLFFTTSKDLALKKWVFPRLVAGSGAVFALLVGLTAPFPLFLFFAPFVALIVWLNIRMTRFCDACGRMLINHMWWSQMIYCPRCGAKLPER